MGWGSECWARSWNGLHARGVGLSAVHKRCFINNTALDEIYFFYIFLLSESKLVGGRSFSVSVCLSVCLSAESSK